MMKASQVAGVGIDDQRLRSLWAELKIGDIEEPLCSSLPADNLGLGSIPGLRLIPDLEPQSSSL